MQSPLKHKRTDTNKKCLAHITGLRGWAILLIVLFHYTIGNDYIPECMRIKNGYLGVEIFMCIMGYFCIQRFLEKGKTDIIRYAYSKFQRLIMPLAILIVIVSMMSIFLLDHQHIKLFSGTASFALLGLSNFELIRSSRDYFAIDSSMNALLHSWYISVAIQLFILAIIICVLLKKCKYTFILLFLILITCVSYCFDFFIEGRHLAEIGMHPYLSDCFLSYYSCIPRIWQFLAGGVVCFLPEAKTQSLRTAATLIGILLILFSVLWYPSFSPLILSSAVVIASMLIIRYGRGNLVLENKIINFFGGISFSFYLIHMPLIILYKGYTMLSPSLPALAAIFTIAIILSYGFSRYIERLSIPILLSAGIWMFALFVSVILFYTNGLKEQINGDINQINYEKYDYFRYRYDNALMSRYNDATMVTYGKYGISIHRAMTSEKCNLLNAQETPFLQIGTDSVVPSFVLIGDSHAIMSYPGLDYICKKNNVSGVLVNSLFLPFMDREYGNPLDSYAINPTKTQDFFCWLEGQNHIENVVIIFSWCWATDILNVTEHGEQLSNILQENIKSLKKYLSELRRLNKKAIVFMPFPRFSSNKMLMYVRWRNRRNLTSSPIRSDYIVTKKQYQNMWGGCIKALSEFQNEGLCSIINPTICLFQNDICYSFNDDNKILFFDSNHMSAGTSINVAKSVEKQLIYLLNEKN